MQKLVNKILYYFDWPIGCPDSQETLLTIINALNGHPIHPKNSNQSAAHYILNCAGFNPTHYETWTVTSNIELAKALTVYLKK